MKTFRTSFKVTATDPDGDALPVMTALNGVPIGATFDGGAFVWTPDNTQPGSYTVTFSVNENGVPKRITELDVVITVGDVPTATEQTDNLMESVITALLPTNIQNSYLANSKKVQKFIDDGQIEPAVNELGVFIDKVSEDITNCCIEAALGNQFIAAAQNLIDELIR